MGLLWWRTLELLLVAPLPDVTPLLLLLRRCAVTVGVAVFEFRYFVNSNFDFDRRADDVRGRVTLAVARLMDVGRSTICTIHLVLELTFRCCQMLLLLVSHA